MYFKIKKLKDNKFEGNHPNEINEGYVTEGNSKRYPTINKSFILINGNNFFKTSTVTEVNMQNQTFKTLNSTYEWTLINDEL